MQRTKPKIISVGNSNRARSFNNLVGEMKLVVSWKKLDYEEVWNINESLGSCGLQRSRCRERDPKSANRTSVCIKIHFRNRRRNGSQKLSRKWTWISTRVKELCKLWSFQTILFLLEGTKLEIEELMKLSQSKWMSELDALLCWRGYRKTRRIIRKTYGEKTVYFSKNEITRSFWRTTSTNDTNHTYILVRETRAWFYFQQFWPVGFSFLKMIENIWEFN